MSSPRVFLGMSGGVDSSVSAILLQEQGYDVTGVYMKNWSQNLPGLKCPWAEDLADAKRVAVQLDLDFEVWDFEQEYKTKVVDYMLAEFAKGRTPNPDVICNELIKFKLFYDRALACGADYIATGHYARTDGAHLLQAADANKDQTYFLYRMSDIATAHTLFPLGDYEKPAVKALAATHHLDVAYKKESMGVCFVGEVGMKDFLSTYLPAAPGEIREQETNHLLGQHDGAIFYTIGQRHGLYLGGGLPYYVVGKNLSTNTVFVSKNLNHPALWANSLELSDLHLRNSLSPAKLAALPDLVVRTRHRGELVPVSEISLTTPAADSATVTSNSIKNLQKLTLHFPAPIKAVPAGQSAVLYSGEICLGGGIVSES